MPPSISLEFLMVLAVSTNFTGQLGTVDSRLAAIVLGAIGSGTRLSFFTAQAFIVRPEEFDPDAATGGGIGGVGGVGGISGIYKNVTLNVLQRRPLALSAFVPPRTPDQEDENPTPTPGCLPPCAGTSPFAGLSIIKQAMTSCDFCDVFYRTDTEYLGKGSDILAKDHCGCDDSHMRTQHNTKLFVDYGSLPKTNFRLRAKLTWDDTGGPFITVAVYGNISAMPDIDLGDCEAYGGSFESGHWNAGDKVGELTFIANDTGVLGGRNVQFQNYPSLTTINGASLSSTILRFELQNVAGSYNAKFRAANLGMDII